MYTQKVLILDVRYDVQIERLIWEAGFAWSNPHICTANFPATRRGEIQLEAALVGFDDYLPSSDIVAQLAEGAYRPAELHELLALAIEHPDEQRLSQIVALGSLWVHSDQNGFVPFLGVDGTNRELRLRMEWGNAGWQRDCLFLAFRK